MEQKMIDRVGGGGVMVFTSTFENISVISWRSVFIGGGFIENGKKTSIVHNY